MVMIGVGVGRSAMIVVRMGEHAEWRVSFIWRGWVGKEMTGVVGIRAGGEVLGGEEGVVVGHRKHVAFLVKVVHEGHPN